MNRLIERIEQRRSELGLSQKEMLKRAAIPEASYRNYLAGRAERMSFDTVRRLSLSLKMSIDELAAYADDAVPSEVIVTIQNDNNTPATTQEVDTAFTVLLRALESFNASHAADMRLIKDEFDAAIAAHDLRYEQLLASKDQQYERERQGLNDRISNQSRVIWMLSAVCILLSVIAIFL